MKIAVEGCCHGHLDEIYSHIQSLEARNNYKVDLLLICGDFQAVRNYSDLQCMAVPNKYKQLGGFYKYYTGERIAPILTIVIGGNHEASNYMWELYHGGWLAPNIYFLGHAGCVQVNGVRIAGASGIFKGHDFPHGNYERLPYTPGTMRSIYHLREFCVRRLSLLSSPTIFLSHDWPQSIEQHGDLRSLLSRKSFLRPDIQSGRLGSPPLMGLLRTLKPQWWFAAHLHTRYEATVEHEHERGGPEQELEQLLEKHVMNPDEIVIDTGDEFDGDGRQEKIVDAPGPPSIERNPDEITLDDEKDVVEAPAAPVPAPTPRITRFLALDKCLPNRKFLEVVDIPLPCPPLDAPSIPILCFDPEWLAIARAFDPWFSLARDQPPFPDESEARALVAQAHEWVVANLQQNDATLPLPVNEIQMFVHTAPGPSTTSPPPNHDKVPQSSAYSNPQTEAFCVMLGIENKINPGASQGGRSKGES